MLESLLTDKDIAIHLMNDKGAGEENYYHSLNVAVLAMLLFGGAALHYFAVALTIGILFGIYSSVLVMAPIVRWLGVRREDLVKPVKERKEEAVV